MLLFEYQITPSAARAGACAVCLLSPFMLHLDYLKKTLNVEIQKHI
jgi:hypothetical protein